MLSRSCARASTPRHAATRAGNVFGRRIEQRAVIGERNRVEVVVRVVGIEGGEAAVLRLQRDHPVRRAIGVDAMTAGFRATTILDVQQGGGHRRVVDIRVIRIVVLERPATGRALGARAAQSPFSSIPAWSAANRRRAMADCVAASSLVCISAARSSRCPISAIRKAGNRPNHRRDGRPVSAASANRLPRRMILGIAEQRHRLVAVDHRREDRAEAVLAVHARQEP
jgi:hypothetical protein